MSINTCRQKVFLWTTSTFWTVSFIRSDEVLAVTNRLHFPLRLYYYRCIDFQNTNLRRYEHLFVEYQALRDQKHRTRSLISLA